MEVPSLHAVDLPLLPPQPPLIKDIESNEYEYSYDAAKIKALEDKLIKVLNLFSIFSIFSIIAKIFY